MSESVAQRNERARHFVARLLSDTQNDPITASDLKRYPHAVNLLEALIPIRAAGFRGVVLTAIVGKHLDPRYDPSRNFYDCNPRAIFEQGIYYALRDHGVPCGKSDPLNVAKNIQKLDKEWATGRRPELAAMAAVEYLSLLREAERDDGEYKALVGLFFRRLNSFALEIAALNAPLSPTLTQSAPVEIGRKLAAFCVECPEAGTMPQFIVGQLIAFARRKNSEFALVEGLQESVFGTNTTSKKPADVWEVLTDSSISNLYEITVKGIDRKRLDDCASSIQTHNLSNHLITFICRVPEDVSNLELVNMACVRGGVTFQFLDIRNVVENLYCIILTGTQRDEFLGLLATFVHDVNRAATTKRYFADRFS